MINDGPGEKEGKTPFCFVNDSLSSPLLLKFNSFSSSHEIFICKDNKDLPLYETRCFRPLSK